MVTKHEPTKKPSRRKTPAAPAENLFAGTPWERLAAIGYSIPDEVLAKRPRDGAQNLKHYLYGHPKKQ